MTDPYYASQRAIRRPQHRSQSGRVLSLLLIWIAGIVALTAFCVLTHWPAVERRLYAAVSAATAPYGYPAESITLDGRIARLSGEVPTSSMRQHIADAVAAVQGIRAVDNLLVVTRPPAEQQRAPTSELSIQVEAGGVRLGGVVPTAAIAEQLELAVAKSFIGQPVTSELNIESNRETPQWLDSAVASLPKLNAVSGLNLQIIGDNVRISGEVVNSNLAEALTESMIDHFADPLAVAMELSAVTGPSDNAAVTDAPDQPLGESEPSGASAAAKQVSPVPVSPVPLIESEEATDLGEDTAAANLTLVSEVDEPIDTNVGTERTDDGVVTADLDAATSARVEQRPIPESPNPVEAPTASSAPRDMGAELDQIDTRGILFESGSATLTADSHALLARIAAILVDFPNRGLIIAGHTDGNGPDNVNLTLSQRRADAVLEFLAERGVDPVRMRATGYGETVPIASDDTPEGRALNRRIELYY